MKEDAESLFKEELLADFFSEADEHLLAIRQALIQLESSVGKAQPESKVVEGLFQNFHSFKGISAIVGLSDAESLAHATEDFLRSLKGGQAQLTSRGLEILMSVAQKIEQMVAAFRAKKPSPGCESLLAELKKEYEISVTFKTRLKNSVLQSTPSSTALLTSVEEAKAKSLLLWKYTFTPSPELSARGININTVRDELAQKAQILKTTPLVKGKGLVTFEFLVASPKTPDDVEVWETKGVIIESAEEPQEIADVPSVGEETELNPFLAPSQVVRVDLKKLDELMRIAGEMVIQRFRLETQLANLNIKSDVYDLRPVKDVSAGLGRSLKDLRGAIMRIRLVPVAEIFARMPFVVRDLSRQTQKQVRLKLEGQDTAIDKYLIERLKDPLLHLVRNAFSHGVETKEERIALAKPAEATIELKALSVGDSVTISIKDDGKGINPDAIIERARSLGLKVPDNSDSDAILKIICSSGFSTRDTADRTSGRGVGMAVVYSAVREMGGHLSMQTAEGQGTEFKLSFPLTLAITEALVVSSAGQTCAVPQNVVLEIIHANESQIQKTNGIEVVAYRSGVLPVVRLNDIFKLKAGDSSKKCLLVINSERGTVGLLTEKILGQREIVVGALRDPLIQVPGISGATELGDGKPVLILDAAALTSGNVRPPEQLATAVKNN